ncbi:MAG: hypothetical protein R3301_19490 [Saprospiraceae bacterium]|nr:hypothetical protein [Saprospiraceae bacterium]
MLQYDYDTWVMNALQEEPEDHLCSAESLARYLIRFNHDIAEIIGEHGEEAAGRAVWHVYGVLSGDISIALDDNDLETGLRVLESVKELYARGFASHCALAAPDHNTTRLDIACEMLWDMDTMQYAVEKHEELLQKAFEVLEFALFLPNQMCQSSAIHGLGHLAFTYPQPA